MARIFVAEDEDLQRELLQDWFDTQGDEVVTVANGDQASEVLSNQDFEVVLMDWEMGPGKKGPEVVREYRGRGGNGIVILMTGRSELADKEAGFEAGVDDYLVKPFHLREITAKIKALLKRLPPALPVVAAGKQTLAIKSCNSCDTIYDGDLQDCPDCYVPLSCEDIEFPGGAQFNEKYEIKGVLGRGGMSVVFKARHRVLEKDFAIKFMDITRSRDTQYLKRFQLEAQALSQMNNEHVVVIHDFGQSESGQPYIVMDFVEGVPLSRALYQVQLLSLSRCLNIFPQVCLGIGHAHQKGIIHRDLKPGNIILSNQGAKEHVTIVDFGVSKRMESSDRPAEQLTREGKIFGTTTYMSPEHCLGQKIDHRSDIYAFGCIMYEMLCGCPPFVGENVLDILHKQIDELPLPVSQARGQDDLPPGLEQIVHITLAKSPGDRFQSMEELERALFELVLSD